MTSKKNFTLVSLLLETLPNYEENLYNLITEIENSPKHSIIVAPEVCLTGFDYENFEEAARFSKRALESLLQLSVDKVITVTLIEKEYIDSHELFYNSAYVLYQNRVVHKQAKHHLFKFGGEAKYFSEGKEEDIVSFEIDGIKFALLICFELRFKKLWLNIEGADIILLPAQWGKIRSEHFKTLSNALAVMNECYVIASDANNSDTTALSGVIDPFGQEVRNSGLKAIYEPFEPAKIKKMRRYLDIGIKSR